MSNFGRKPTTRKGKKFLERREPKLIEQDKLALLFKGGKTTPNLTGLFMDIYQLKNPLVQKLNQRNSVHLYENSTFVEKMSRKYDTSMFMMVSRTKKRPETVTLGRLFDYQLLDMVDLRVLNYKGAAEFYESKCAVGTKPCILLQGTNFENDEVIKRIGNLFVDFFRGPVVSKIRLQGLELIISLTATEDRIFLRTYRAVLKKSVDVDVPYVELKEIGPNVDFAVDRNKFASDHLMTKAMKKPKQLKVKPRKNISTNVLGTTHGRIHLGRQNVGGVQTRKVKALRKPMKQVKNV